MSLDADVRISRPGFVLEARVQADAGGVVAITGPNGAGKTTLLRALAGLCPLDGGRIVLDGTTLEDPAARVSVAAEDRDLALVSQRPMLFPHLSVVDNVAFGLRMRGIGAARARSRAADWLERMGAAHLGRRHTDQLSGGEAQRVALARALITEPRLLLLDEPLASVDACARGELRSLLRRHLGAHPGIRLLVTHDRLDCAALATSVVVLEAGRIVRDGSISAVPAASVSS